MEISFVGLPIPQNYPKGYLHYYIEGRLKIVTNRQIIFDEPEVAIVELAISMKKWLAETNSKTLKTFTYLSIDNDQPIFSFAFDNSHFTFQSNWGKNSEISLIGYEELQAAFVKYVADVEKEYQLKL